MLEQVLVRSAVSLGRNGRSGRPDLPNANNNRRFGISRAQMRCRCWQPRFGSCGGVGGPRAMPAAAATLERRLGQLAAASGVLRVTRTATDSIMMLQD